MKTKAINYFAEALATEVNEIREAGEIFVNKQSRLEKILNNREVQVIINHLTTHRLRQTAMFYLQFPGKYIPATTEKLYALDYLCYIAENNPDIPFDLFPREDHEEILKYLKNKYLIATYLKLLAAELFSKKDIVLQKQYSQIEKRGWSGFNSTEYSFTENVIIERCGVNRLRRPFKINGTTILDCGPCEGDSTWQLNYDLKPKLIVAIEPEADNFKKLVENLRLNHIENALPLNVGVSNKKMNAHMIPGQGGASTITSMGNLIKINTLDNLCKDNHLDKIGLIKMDVEGFEYETLEGAKTTIQKYRPALAVALYHKGKDFFEIPYLLKSWVKNYKFRFLNLNRRSATLERWLLAEDIK